MSDGLVGGGGGRKRFNASTFDDTSVGVNREQITWVKMIRYLATFLLLVAAVCCVHAEPNITSASLYTDKGGATLFTAFSSNEDCFLRAVRVELQGVTYYQPLNVSVPGNDQVLSFVLVGRPAVVPEHVCFSLS